MNVDITFASPLMFNFLFICFFNLKHFFYVFILLDSSYTTTQEKIVYST